MISVTCEDVPHAVVATRDGPQAVHLLEAAREACSAIRAGDSLVAEGVKQTEQRFEAHRITVERQQPPRPPSDNDDREYLLPAWPAPPAVCVGFTTRAPQSGRPRRR